MNHSNIKSEDMAQLCYGDGNYTVTKPGRFVICDVSKRLIDIQSLRYWNAETQKAYFGPEEALTAWRAKITK